MVRWKAETALLKPKGKTSNWNNPFCDIKAVFCSASLLSPICQYPDARSSDVKNLAPFNVSSVSSISGIG